MGERTATLGRRGAAHGVERALQLGDLMAMGFELLRHRSQCRRRRIEFGHGQARGTGDLFHVFLALVLAALMAFEALGVDLQAHTRTSPFLGLRNRLAQHVLATGVAAFIAHAQRQIHTHVGIVGQHREPGLGCNIAHAGNDDLVLARHALKGARAGNVGGLVTCSRRDNVVIQVLGARRGEMIASVGQAAAHRPHLRQESRISMASSSTSMALTGHTSMHAVQPLFSFLQVKHGMVLPRGRSL
mgnify:CR=1 FL=1